LGYLLVRVAISSGVIVSGMRTMAVGVKAGMNLPKWSGQEREIGRVLSLSDRTQKRGYLHVQREFLA
jgi:hypothetical protein